MGARVEIRVHEGAGPALIYLPGLHGDWGLIGAFRRAVAGRVRFVEFSYSRGECTLEELAAAVDEALSGAGIRSGWLLAQSFGSQVAWALMERGFQTQGLVLAGGFVKHPWPWGARLFQILLGRTPAGVIRPVYSAYTAACNALARRKAQEAGELMAFAAARGPEAWRAAAWRLTLIVRADPRPTARRTRAPVHYLGGGIDPLVPWPTVTAWLSRECPGYRGRLILTRADHNVLGSAPRESAEAVLGWLGA